ncbi:MAG: hypothetical protein HY270_18415 [Deltaproteobacteria bacterium]|nr:hypothetical protein [Deltaproteobacteria bacterium]
MPRDTHDCCHHRCGDFVAERNRYFTGKYMTERDFSAEQEYFVSRHRIHNRLLHGWGVVCGLRVDYHPDWPSAPNSDCARGWVVIEPGVAIDCQGRELVVCKKRAYRLPLRPDAGDTTEEPPGEIYDPPFLLCLQYKEEPIDYVPALYSEGACDPTRREPNRVRETAELVVRRLDDVPGCWPIRDGREGSQRYDDCDDCKMGPPGPHGACLEPICPCGDVVPLALIGPAADSSTDGVPKPFTIDHAGRRELPLPRAYQTHIVRINWEHGGELSLKDLISLGDKLEVWFDRPLRPAEGDATGINAYTFLVQYGGAQRDVEFLPAASDPELSADGYRATFTIDPSYVRGRDNIAGNVVFVTLRCDFILDCHGNPVDGNHLRGRLPSGDGTVGGTFESWFRVVDRRRNEEAK